MNQDKLTAMKEGGHKLALIRDELIAFAKPGVVLQDIENLANKLIDASGSQAAFKKVPGYHWATCLNVNDVIVHGIPNGYALQEGDLLSIDIGLYHKGYYTDTTASTIIGTPAKELRNFLETGQRALNAGIKQARAGAKVSDISRAIQQIIEGEGFTVVRELTGHGVGKRLHEEPYVPNFVEDGIDKTLEVGQTLAIEPMYTTGNGKIKISKDGWTIKTADGSLAGQIEHTIAITQNGPLILTK